MVRIPPKHPRSESDSGGGEYGFGKKPSIVFAYRLHNIQSYALATASARLAIGGGKPYKQPRVGQGSRTQAQYPDIAMEFGAD
jgi:hypothetical protein